MVVYHVERDYNLYICNTQRLEEKGSRNMCTCCRKDEKVPDIWSDENNMDPMLLPKELSKMSDTEQMLISRLVPTIHVHMLKHGGIALPQAVKEPATILPHLPAKVHIIWVRSKKRMTLIGTSGLEDIGLTRVLPHSN